MKPEEQCEYRNSYRPARAQGSATLVLPFLELTKLIVRRFVTLSLSALQTVPKGDEIFRLRSDYQLRNNNLNLSDPIDDTVPREDAWSGTVKDLKRLSATAADLASEQGDWTEDGSELAELSDACCSHLTEKILRFSHHMLRDYGSYAAIEALEDIRTRLIDEQTSLRARLKPLPRSLAKDLNHVSRRLAQFSKLRGAFFARMVVVLNSEAPIRRLIPSEWRLRINRDEKVLKRAREQRHTQLTLEAKLSVLDRLVGRNGETGFLASQLQVLRTQSTNIARIAKLTQPADEELFPSSSTELFAVSSLDQVLDSDSGTTFSDVGLEALRDVGCTPENFIASLREDGITVAGLRKYPHEFSELDPGDAATELVLAGERFLGIVDDQWTISGERAQSGLAALSQLSLLSPQLMPRSMALLSSLVQLSRPYAEFRSVAGRNPITLGFLYCPRPDRDQWRRHLRGKIVLSDDGDGRQYDLRNPFALAIEQHTIAAPISTFPRIWKWISVGNLVRKRQTVAPLLDRDRLVDFRQLDSRIRDADHCVEMLEAAQKSMIVHELPNERLAYSGRDKSIGVLFAEISLTPRWITATRLHSLVSMDEFVRLLYQLYPELLDIRADCLRMSRENDATFVAKRLLLMGVVEQSSGRFRLTRSPDNVTGTLQDELFEVHHGAIRGLTRDEFVSALLEDDTLFNAIHWSVLDAYERGHVTRNDVPDSISRLSEKLSG